MTSGTTLSRPGPDAAGLIHQGLIYDTDEQFLAATVPFCLDGLACDDAVLAVTTPANIDLLRQQLGDAAGNVEFIAADQWYDAPGRTLAAYHRYVDKRTGDAGRHRQVRVIGEPVWHGRDALETTEWTRYESVINMAFADCPAWIVCPYDARVMPPPVVADARRTHPQLVTGPTAENSVHYAAPAPDGVWHRELTRPPRDGREAVMRFGADLTAVRTFVAAKAMSLGMSATGAGRLTFAVNEVATNALQHGGGTGQVTLWRDGRRIVCDVTDTGRTATGWYLGYLPPGQAQLRGHGLWAVRQLCDLRKCTPSRPAPPSAYISPCNGVYGSGSASAWCPSPKPPRPCPMRRRSASTARPAHWPTRPHGAVTSPTPRQSACRPRSGAATPDAPHTTLATRR